MDEDLGHVSYDTDRPGFLGTGDQSSWLNRRYSDATAERMDAKVRDIVDGVFKRTLTLLETNLDLLEQSAQDLLQRETLDEPNLVAIGAKLKRTEAVAA
jgi:cell division protease FtsH